MRSLLSIGIVMGLGFILLGYAARTPGQAALSNAVIAIGVSVLIFVAVISTVRYLANRTKEGPRT